MIKKWGKKSGTWQEGEKRSGRMGAGLANGAILHAILVTPDLACGVEPFGKEVAT
jgi:hypothetical protein